MAEPPRDKNGDPKTKSGRPDFKDYLLSGPTVDDFEVERSRDLGRDGGCDDAEQAAPSSPKSVTPGSPGARSRGRR